MTFTKRQEEAVRALVGLPHYSAWQPMDGVTYEVAIAQLREEVQRIDRAKEADEEWKARRVERTATPKPQRLASQSAKRKAEKARRDEVRHFVIQRANHRCEGPAYGLPGECGMVSMERAPLEVHETHARGTHPGSHLDEEKCVALCQRHHDMVTSPVGELRKLVERCGLIVRATS